MRYDETTVDLLLGDPAERGDPLWWFELARCGGRRRLFIDTHGPHSPAKAVCADCVCQNVCVWYALKSEPLDLPYHVYGGLTPDERRSFAQRYGVTHHWAHDEYVRERRRLWEFLINRKSHSEDEIS